MLELPQCVQVLLNEIAHTEGFIDPCIEVVPGTGEVNGLASVMTKVKISGPRECLQKDKITHSTLHLLCKLTPASPEWIKEMKTDEAFEREGLMYDEILPMMAKFECEKGLLPTETFSAYPKCYRTLMDKENSRFAIIMEDLSVHDFVLWPKHETMPVEHARLMMEELAKFHAISFALRDQRPHEFKRLQSIKDRYANNCHQEFIMKLVQMGFDKTLAALDCVEHRALVEEYRARVFDYFEDCTRSDACEPYGALTHGDFWINNLMFRHDDVSPDPAGIRLIDWQFARFSSPVLDIHFIIATSTDKEFRKLHHTELMRHYHSTLSQAITRLGSDPMKLYPFDCFEADLRKFGNFAFLVGFCVTQFVLDDIPNSDQVIEEIIKNDAKMNIFNGSDGEKVKAYNKRIADLVEDFVNYDYFRKLDSMNVQTLDDEQSN